MTSVQIERATGDFMRAADRLPSLYRLSDEWNYLLALLEDAGSDPEQIELELKRVAGDITRKAHGVAAVYHTLLRMAEMQKLERDRLAARAKANEAYAERIRQYALACMQAIGEQRLETGAFTLARVLNNPAVTVVDEDAIPDEFWRQPEPPPREVDKQKLLKHWRTTGEVAPGVEIGRKERLDIR